MVKEKNIALCLILSILTCGIYTIIWFIEITDDVRTLSGNEKFSGLKAILLTLVTCGLYRLYWSYQVGKELGVLSTKINGQNKDNSILYLILDLFSLSLINYCLMQNDINEILQVSNNNIQQ